jgi:hypothetical protein
MQRNALLVVKDCPKTKKIFTRFGGMGDRYDSITEPRNLGVDEGTRQISSIQSNANN